MRNLIVNLINVLFLKLFLVAKNDLISKDSFSVHFQAVTTALQLFHVRKPLANK